MMVLDTDVFIDHFRGREAATTYSHSPPAEQRATTDITVMELYKGAANQQELATILRFLPHNHVDRLPVPTRLPRSERSSWGTRVGSPTASGSLTL